MWYLAAAQTGLNLLGAGMQYNAASAQSKAERAWQTYSNTMTNLSGAVGQNAITKNEVLSNQAFADQDLQNQKMGMLTEAHAEVSAAAAGVQGRSVNQTMFAIQRGVAEQEYKRQQSLQNANSAFDQQRLTTSLSGQMQQNYSYIPNPSSASYLLNAATSSIGGSGFQSLFGPNGSNGSGQVLATSGAMSGQYVTPTFFT